MNLDTWLVCSELCRNLEHVACKLYFLARCQVIGVIFHESCGTLAAFGHFFKDSLESSDLVVTLRSKADTLCHHILGCDSRKLVKSVQILE